MKITGKLFGKEFEIVKYKGIKVKSDDSRVVEVLESMTANIFNPQTTSSYTARVIDSLLDAYLVLLKRKKDGLDVEFTEVPDNLIEQPDYSDDEYDEKVY